MAAGQAGNCALLADVELQSTRRLAERAANDTEFMQVAELYRKRSDFDVNGLVAELVEGGEILIGARCSSERLTVWVENPFDPESRPGSGAGVGLANVRHRLENVFGNEARIRSGGSGGIFRAEVLIPVVKAGSASERKDDSDS